MEGAVIVHMDSQAQKIEAKHKQPCRDDNLIAWVVPMVAVGGIRSCLSPHSHLDTARGTAGLVPAVLLSHVQEFPDRKNPTLPGC